MRDAGCCSIVILGPWFFVLLRLVGASVVGVCLDRMSNDCTVGAGLSASVAGRIAWGPVCFLAGSVISS